MNSLLVSVSSFSHLFTQDLVLGKPATLHALTHVCHTFMSTYILRGKERRKRPVMKKKNTIKLKRVISKHKVNKEEK